MRIRLFLNVLLLCSYAGAEDSIFQAWQVSGDGCDQSNVHVLKSYDTLSLLLDNFAVHFQSKQDKEDLQANKNCIFKIDVLPPVGFYLASFSQLYSGGILKTAGAEVRLDIDYKVASIMNRQSFEWSRGKAIGPQDPESVFSKTFTDLATKMGCREKFQYHIKLTIHAQRKGRVSVGLDSVDAQAGSQVNLVANWKPCKAKPVR